LLASYSDNQSLIQTNILAGLEIVCLHSKNSFAFVFCIGWHTFLSFGLSRVLPPTILGMPLPQRTYKTWKLSQ